MCMHAVCATGQIIENSVTVAGYLVTGDIIETIVVDVILAVHRNIERLAPDVIYMYREVIGDRWARKADTLRHGYIVTTIVHLNAIIAIGDTVEYAGIIAGYGIAGTVDQAIVWVRQAVSLHHHAKIGALHVSRCQRMNGWCGWRR